MRRQSLSLYTLATTAVVCGSSTALADATSDIQAFRDSYYTDADIRHSFTSKHGEHIDCIDYYAQPSVRNMKARGLPVLAAGAPPAASRASGQAGRPGPMARDAFDG